MLVVTGEDILEPHDINTCVVPYYAVKWREVGEALRIPSWQLDIIKEDNLNSCEKRCKAVLEKWRKQNHSATWGKLVDAVKNINPEPSTLPIASAIEGMHIYYKLI